MKTERAEPCNQWLASTLHTAFEKTAEWEVESRMSVNPLLTRGVRLSVKPDAVLRDVMRQFLSAAAPAGNG
jgi:hypothetical protein